MERQIKECDQCKSEIKEVKFYNKLSVSFRPYKTNINISDIGNDTQKLIFCGLKCLKKWCDMKILECKLLA